MLLVGDVPKGAVPRTLLTPSETNQLNVSPLALCAPLVSLTTHISKYGEVIMAWHYLFVWNEHCMSADDFEPCVDIRRALAPEPLMGNSST